MTSNYGRSEPLGVVPNDEDGPSIEEKGETIRFPAPCRVKDELERSRTNKSYRYREWDWCLNMLDGKHNLEWNSKTNEWFLPTRKHGDRRKKAVNIVLNMYETTLSLMATNYPSIAVMPELMTTDDMIKAKACEYAINHFWHHAGMEEAFEEIVEWMVGCGPAASLYYFDDETGEVEHEVFGPYDMFFEAGANHLKQSMWRAVRRFIRKDLLVEAYDDSDLITEDEIAQLPFARTNDAHEDNRGEVPRDRVEVFEVYWTDGSNRRAIIAGDKYLWLDQWTTTYCPLIPYEFKRVKRNIWPFGMVRQVIDLQRRYNDLRQQVDDNSRLMANPVWVYDPSANIPDWARTNKPGLWIPAQGRFPTQVAPAPMPGYIMDHTSRTMSEMMDVGGIHSTSMGKRAVGVGSGAAVRELSARDTNKLRVSMRRMERAAEKGAKVVLELMQQNYPKEKMIRIFDEDGSPIHRMLKRTDLLENPEVRIQAGSLFRDTAEERDRKLQEWMQFGAVAPDKAFEQSSFRVQGVEAHRKWQGLVWAKEMLAAAVANASIPLEARAESHENWIRLEITDWDDIDACTEVFGEFMRTGEYMELPKDVQEYIGAVFVAMVNYPRGQPPQGQSVWPRKGPSPMAPPQPMVGPRRPGPIPSSPTLAPGEAPNIEEAMTARNEAIMSMPGSGGLG